MPHDVARICTQSLNLDQCQTHVGQRIVANFDITDFFPSTKQKMVKAVLKRHYNCRMPMGSCSGLCCLHGELPQGAPTSPHLANLAMWMPMFGCLHSPTSTISILVVRG